MLMNDEDKNKFQINWIKYLTDLKKVKAFLLYYIVLESKTFILKWITIFKK